MRRMFPLSVCEIVRYLVGVVGLARLLKRKNNKVLARPNRPETGGVLGLEGEKVSLLLAANVLTVTANGFEFDFSVA